MKRRADYEVGTLENKVEMQINEALKSIDTLVSSLNTLKSTLNDTINSTNNNKLKDNVDSSVKTITALKKALNFGAVYVGLRKGWNVIKDITSANIDMTETNNLFEVSMGKIVDQYGNLDAGASKYYTKAMAFQNEMNEKLATNKSELMNYQAMYYSMFKSQGINLDSSYLMSESLTKAGYDIASLYNLTVDEAMTKLKSGIAGQVEPLRAIGIDISESSLSKVLDNVGIERSVQQLSYAEKEVARYIAIIDQAKQAQGDFARTFEQPANQIRVFKNQIAELRQVAGAFIINTFGWILTYVNAIIMVIKEILKSLAGLFGYDLNTGGVDLSTATGIQDLNDGLGSAGKKAKELKKQLMGFDEINNIDPNSQTSGGSGSGSSGIGGIDQKLLDSLKEWDNMMDSISGKAQEIRDKMLKWLGFVRNDDGTWRLKEGLTNFQKIKEVVEAIGIALLSWKVASAITNLLKNLGIFKGNSFQMAFGITLAVSGIFLLYKGIRHLLDGDVDLFTILETIGGGALATFGIANILRSIKNGKTFTWGQSLMIGFGITLSIVGVEVLKHGIDVDSIKEKILGVLGLSTGISLVATTALSKLATIFPVVSTALGGATTSFAGLLGIFGKIVGAVGLMTVGLISMHKTIEETSLGTDNAIIRFFKLEGSLIACMTAGALLGSMFGPVGTAIGVFSGLAIGWITGLIEAKVANNEASEAVKGMQKELEEYNSTLEESIKTSEEAMKSIQNTFESKMMDAQYSQELANQLYKIVDANGHIIKGNEEMADFILGELNNALGTNLTRNGELLVSNGEVVDSHSKLQGAIDGTIEQLKKQAEAEAYQDIYKQKVKERIEQEQNLKYAVEQLGEAQKLWASTSANDPNYDKVRENYYDWKEAVEEGIDAVNEKYLEEQYSLDALNNNMQGNSNEILKIVDTTWTDIEKKITNSSDNVEKNVNDSLDNMNTNMDKKTNNMMDIIRNKQGVAEQEGRGLANSIENGAKNLDLNTDVDNKVNSMMGIINSKHDLAKTESEGLANVVEAGVGTLNTEFAGKQSVEGVARGINQNKNNQNLLNSIGALKDYVVTKFKEKFGIHSPSTVMANLAQYIPEGFAQGIDDNSYQAIKSAKKMAENVNSVVGKTTDIDMLKSLNNGIQVNTKDFAVDSTQYVDYGAIQGKIQAQSNISMSGNMIKCLVQAVKEGMRESEVNVNIEAKTDEGVIVKKVAQGFTEYVKQTDELPFPVPV